MSNDVTGIYADGGLSFPLHNWHVGDYQSWVRMSGLLKDEAAEHDEMGIHLVELQVVRVKKSIEQIDAEMKTVGDSVATFEQAGAKTKHLELLREHRARLEKWLVQTAATPPVPDTAAPVGPASNGPVSKITAPAQPPEVESTVVLTDTGTTAPEEPAELATDSAKSVPLSRTIHSTKTRRNTLTPVIELAQTTCRNPKDTAEVWATLLVLAEQKHTPLLGATEEGIQYLNHGEAAIFKREALRKRLGR
jgi:hypothetical protein